MTIDEAIVKAKEDGDVQLAEWLRHARGAESAARWYTGKLRDAHRNIRKVLIENAKLRELLQRTWDVFHNASGKEFGAVKQELRELGIEVQ